MRGMRRIAPKRTARRLTVGSIYQGRDFVPLIRMSGKWLAAAGFPAGCHLVVRAARGRVVVRVAEPNPKP